MNEQLSLLDDICLNRHNGSETSLEANDKVNKKYWRDKVMEISRGREMWLHLACRMLGKKPNELSPRFTELKERNLLKPNGKRQEGCAVLVECK